MQAEVAPPDVTVATVHLEGDRTLEIGEVDYIRARNAIHPCTNVRAETFDAVVIPPIRIECSHRVGIILEWMDPTPAQFVIETTRPSSRTRINLYLIATNTTRALPWFRLVTSNLPTGIPAGVDLDFTLENEVTVLPAAHQEGVLTRRTRAVKDLPLASDSCVAPDHLPLLEPVRGKECVVTDHRVDRRHAMFSYRETAFFIAAGLFIAGCFLRMGDAGHREQDHRERSSAHAFLVRGSHVANGTSSGALHAVGSSA